MKKYAFSLVELSIVLVILGLLTGGILTGQSLIRAAELRSVTTEFMNYQTAVRTFQSKYFALPGDMLNAEDFWDSMSTGTCPNATAGVGTETCNGNGNGAIDASPAASQAGEAFTFWQHLTNAGLIEGTYSGVAGSGSTLDGEIGENIPASKLSNAGWSVFDWDPPANSSLNFNASYRNVFFFGSEEANLTEGAILVPEEAWGIDTKIDDGMPATGSVMVRDRVDCAVRANGTAITTSAADAAALDAEYNLSNSAIECSFVIRRVF